MAAPQSCAMETETTCAICLDCLQLPRTLACGHNFCKTCLLGYVQNLARTHTDLNQIQCPQCREQTTVPDPSSPIEDWMEQFNCGSSLPDSEGRKETKDIECGVCGELAIKSEYICSTCTLGFCGRCYSVHEKIPACAEHEVQKLGFSPSNNPDMFGFLVRVRTSSTPKQRQRLSEKLKTEICQKIEHICDQVRESVAEKGEQYMEKTNKMVGDIFESFNSRHQDSNHRPPSASNEDEDMDDSFEACIALSSLVKPFLNSRCEAVVGRADVVWDFDGEGEIDERDDGHVVVVDVDDASSESSSSEIITPELTTTINAMAEDDDDYQPWIRNIIAVTACDIETVICTDFNNSCLKSFYHEDGRSMEAEGYDVSRLPLNGRPWGLAMLEQEKVAVTCPKEKLIAIIKVKPELEVLSYKKVSKELYGLAAMDSATVVASAAKEVPAGLFIVDADNGAILKQVVSDRKGRALFHSPFYITLSAEREVVVVEERSRRVLFATTSGVVRDGRYGDCQLQSVYGVTCSRAGNVYVADREAHRILRVWEDDDDDDDGGGECYDVLVSQADGISFPRCMCFYGNEVLYVAEEGGKIKRFRLTYS